MTRRGECFLCRRDVTMTRKRDSALGDVYVCPRCGGMNSVKRIEAGVSFSDWRLSDWSPRKELS